MSLASYKSILLLDYSERSKLMVHCSKSGHVRVREHVETEKAAQKLEEYIKGRDLVEMALTDPAKIIENPPLQKVLPGRTCYFADEIRMISRITNKRSSHGDYLISCFENFDYGLDTGLGIPAQLDAWKLVYCDLKFTSNTFWKNSSRLVPNERERVARRVDMKLARRNIKWVLPFLEPLWTKELAAEEPREFIKVVEDIWKQGSVFYKTQEVEQKYGHRWVDLWDNLNGRTLPMTFRDEPCISYACLGSIHCRDNADTSRELKAEIWAPMPTYQDLSEEDALRKHFKIYRKSLLSPGILQNTFIVIPAELIPEDPWWDRSCSLDSWWVWAYDADWDPSSSTEDATSDGEQYQGRIKVALYSVDSWFCSARSEGVSLRDMWLKAQKHPDKLWICHSKPMEEWEDTPYV